MTRFTTLAGAGAILMLSAAAAFAAPCTTGTAGKQANKDTSSNVDGGSATKTSPGAKAESPGTVGAMSKAGVDQGLGDKQASDKAEAGSKNLAGGEQPASPGTVGAMNRTGADQKLGDQAKKGDDC